MACGDIRKMFHQIAVRDIDMHLRRFLWRPDGLGGNHPWRIAVPTSVNFGETAAPTIATKVKNRAAEDYKHISQRTLMTISERLRKFYRMENSLSRNGQRAETKVKNVLRRRTQFPDHWDYGGKLKKIC